MYQYQPVDVSSQYTLFRNAMISTYSSSNNSSMSPELADDGTVNVDWIPDVDGMPDMDGTAGGIPDVDGTANVDDGTVNVDWIPDVDGMADMDGE